MSYYHIEDEEKKTINERRKNSSAGGKRRKRVSFSETSMLHLIPTIDCYSKEEKEAMYITAEDNERIQEENNRTIEEIRKGNMPDTESECFRGLENKGLQHLWNQKRAMRQITLSLIISEQEQGEDICPDWIENVYCTITEDSVAQANRSAYWDAQSAQKDIMSTFHYKLHIDWIQKVGAIVQ
jgi:hypothetical protein